MRLRWSAEARQQLIEARSYIAQDNPRAARDLALAIRSTAERLLVFPHSGRLDAEIGARICVVPGTPYALHYDVAGDIVRILSVWHGARRWPPVRD